MNSYRSHPGRLPGLVVAAALVLLVLPASAMSFVKPKVRVVGRVYTETNNPTNNQVVIFNRLSNGKLRRIGAVSTGGKGGLQNQPGCTPPGGCPFLDTQNEVLLANKGTLLFAVNAGSNTVSSFQATPTGLKLASVIGSHGTFPNSLTVHGNLLYVLNSGKGASAPDISGFVFTVNGKLIPISRSTQPLVGGAIPGLPRQIGFDRTGHVLMVSLLANTFGPPPAGGTKETIDTFPVNTHGQARPGTAHDSTGKFPFAFAFNKQNQAIMAQVNALTPTPGTAQRYSAAGVPIGGGVTTVDFAPCWVVVSANGRHAYIVNTGGGAPGGATVVAYRIGPFGGLTRLRATKALNEFVKTDEALSADGRFLYVVSPLEQATGSSTTPGPTSHIDEYAVQPNGTLRLIGRTASLPIPGLTGLAAT